MLRCCHIHGKTMATVRGYKAQYNGYRAGATQQAKRQQAVKVYGAVNRVPARRASEGTGKGKLA